ncbi:MAG: hypothetical protein H8E86_03350 [Planctomycetes bacterium]|nr:hypothetical protein [Planctomycetota bacterium]
MFVTSSILVITTLTSSPDNKIEALTGLVQELRQEVYELKINKSESWINEQRADEIRLLVQDVLSDTDTRTSLQGSGAMAGYNGGAFLASADGNWKLKINGQIQVRWLYNDAKGQTSQHGFEQRRTKVKFSGHVIDPSWTFKVTATWSRSGGSNTEDAWIAKSFDNGSWVKAGQFASRFLREQNVSSSKQLTVERSMLNNAFTYGWTQGIEYGWKNEDMKFVAQYTDGPNQANSASLGASTNAYVLRTEFRFGDAGWKDFAYLTSNAGADNGLLIGVAYENYDTDGGAFEYGNANGTKSSGWTVDASWRGDGWNLFGYIVDTTGKDNAGVTQDSSGWLVQGGFLVNDNVELFAQLQEGDVNGEAMDMDAFRVGFNYWPATGNNSVKWTTDVGWASKTLTNGAGGGISSADWVSSGNGWRADNANEDNQMLLRTQLQLLL